MPNKDDKIGALWQKSSDKGDYFTGEVEIAGTKQRIVVFVNGYKDSDAKPDYVIYKSRPRE